MKIKVTLGDTWALGNHSLFCGDSATWRPPQRARMAFADPPYNAGVADWDIGFNWRHDWLEEWADYVFVTPGSANIRSLKTQMTYRQIYTCITSNGIAPAKDSGLNNSIHILLFSRLKSLQLQRYPTHRIGSENRRHRHRRKYHRGAKPIQLIQWLMGMTTSPGDIVIDPFLGSGSSILAAEGMGRICHGAEINPDYCSRIIEEYCSEFELAAALNPPRLISRDAA